MKNPLILLTLLVSLILPSCGPNEADLRAELQAIESEMVMLRNAAYRYQSQMSQAEFASFVSGLATGYGNFMRKAPCPARNKFEGAASLL